jgi:ankyrin repeat protein
MDAYVNSVAIYLFAQSWQIALLAGVAGLISFTLRNRSAHIRYLLWLIVLAKCLVPPIYSVPVAVLPDSSPVEQLPHPVLLEAPADDSVAVKADASIKVEAILKPRESKPAVANTREIIVLTWLVGAFLFLLWVGGRAVRYTLWLRCRRMSLPPDMKQAFQELFASLKLKKLPRIWLTRDIGQPFVWGLLRGSVYLPADFVGLDGPQHCRTVLAHELGHIARFDAGVNLLQVLAQAIYWFHPFAWWANRKIRVEREKCCDEMAVAHLSMAPEHYTGAIVEAIAAERRSAHPVPSLAIVGSVKDIEERIRTMMRPEKNFYKRPSVIAATVVSLLAILTVPTALVLTVRATTDAVPGPQAKSTEPLHRAAVDGDIEQVRSLIAKGADVNAKSGWKNLLPLHVAARYGHKDISEVLIHNGADVDAETRRRVTPLFYAAFYGHKDVAELLIDKGADVNAKSRMDGATPLYWAAAGGHKGLMDRLLAKGADANAALFCAAHVGHSDATTLLLAKGANVNAKDDKSRTPLHEATSYCHKDVAELLIAEGANVNAKDDSGMTPAYTAFGLTMFFDQQQIVEMVNLLLAKGTKTDIHLAAFSGDLNKVKSFLEEGIDVNAKIEVPTGRMKEVLTPLCLAIISGQKEVVRFLILEGADVNAIEESASSHVNAGGLMMPPLFVLLSAAGFNNLLLFDSDMSLDISFQVSNPAVKESEETIDESLRDLWPNVRDVIELLLDRGANVNEKGLGGRVLLLHRVANAGIKEAVELFIAHGADVNAKDKSGWTALHYACWKNHKDVVEFLLANGADVNAQAKEGKTPLAVAEKEGRTEIIELLKKHGAKE